MSEPCKHDISQDCPACMQEEIERLSKQLEYAMQWQEALIVNIDPDAYYVVKDNGGEWRDFDLHVMSGLMVLHRMEPHYVRGRPEWIAKITKPNCTQSDELREASK